MITHLHVMIMVYFKLLNDFINDIPVEFIHINFRLLLLFVLSRMVRVWRHCSEFLRLNWSIVWWHMHHVRMHLLMIRMVIRMWVILMAWLKVTHLLLYLIIIMRVFHRINIKFNYKRLE